MMMDWITGLFKGDIHSNADRVLAPDALCSTALPLAKELVQESVQPAQNHNNYSRTDYSMLWVTALGGALLWTQDNFHDGKTTLDATQ